MRMRILVFSFLLISAAFFPTMTLATDMTPEYLRGNWVIGTTEPTCGTANSEYFVFNNNGTFEAGRVKKAEAVGFWQVEDDTVYLVFIASGGFFQDIHAELKGYENTFDSFDVKLVPFNIKENRFEAVGVLGDEVNKGIAIRCK